MLLCGASPRPARGVSRRALLALASSAARARADPSDSEAASTPSRSGVVPVVREAPSLEGAKSDNALASTVSGSGWWCNRRSIFGRLATSAWRWWQQGEGEAAALEKLRDRRQVDGGLDSDRLERLATSGFVSAAQAHLAPIAGQAVRISPFALGGAISLPIPARRTVALWTLQ